MKLSFSSSGRKCVLAALVAILLFHCDRHQPRVTEPSLSGFDDWRDCTKTLARGNVVETVRCGDTNLPREFVSLAVSECEGKMTSAKETVRVLGYVAACTDIAVEKLEQFAREQRGDATVLSDLSGAYIVRAQRKNQPADFVRALDAADRAVAAGGELPAARFNRALAQEALGFTDEAIASWDALRADEDAPWRDEAAQHSMRLVARRSRSAATRWKNNKILLPERAAAGDRKAVRAMIDSYHTLAQRYVEEEVLRAWAEASLARQTDKAEQQLVIAEIIATELNALSREGDRYLLDSVERIRLRGDEDRSTRLEEGHLLLGAARDRSRTFSGSVEEKYRRSASLLADAGSPMHLAALAGVAASLTVASRFDEAWSLLEHIEQIAARKGYASLRGRVYAARGYLRMTQGYDLDALAEYGKAKDIFEETGDLENAGSVQNIFIGLFRRIGHEDLTWRSVFQSRRYVRNLVEAQARHINSGECALSALALGYPSIALRYQNIAVQMLENETSNATGTDLEYLRRNVGVARRTRALIEASLSEGNPAADAAVEADLAEAARLLAGGEKDSNRDVRDKDPITNGFRARIAEVRARQMARMDRKKAIHLLTGAIQLAANAHYGSLIASLLTQRARLYRLEGQARESVADLEAAIALLREEERAAVKSQEKLTESERLWSALFSRSQEAYRELVQHHVEQNADAIAFGYAEKARAYEPLQLLLKRTDLPAEFRALIHDDEPLDLETVKRVLPAGTYVLEYSVHDDVTHVWIIGKDFSVRKTLSVGEKQIHAWTRSIQKYASMQNDEAFEASLDAPYDRLLATPVGIVTRREPNARIVIVPDRSMHGLPFAGLRHAERYLIETHPISVQGSATLYAFSLMQDRHLPRDTSQSVLLFADPRFDENLDIAYKQPRLTAARTEAQQIHDLYAPIARVDPPYMDERATVPALLALAPDSSIVHIAAHGITNPDAPSRSFLLLAPADGDSGIIDAERLLRQLQLTKTRLAVLSACSSAGGTPVGPEGLAPLVRPLLAAGVPGIAGTLWNVGDNQATQDLLVRFHKHYRDGYAADVALQKAQMEMIHDPLAGHRAPRSWSAFQFNGYASSPFPPSNR
jgi:CHAT domain-containing protein